MELEFEPVVRALQSTHIINDPQQTINAKLINQKVFEVKEKRSLLWSVYGYSTAPVQTTLSVCITYVRRRKESRHDYCLFDWKKNELLRRNSLQNTEGKPIPIFCQPPIVKLCGQTFHFESSKQN